MNSHISTYDWPTLVQLFTDTLNSQQVNRTVTLFGDDSYELNTTFGNFTPDQVDQTLRMTKFVDRQGHKDEYGSYELDDSVFERFCFEIESMNDAQFDEWVQAVHPEVINISMWN